MHFDFTRGKNTFLQIKTFATLWRIYYMPSMKNNCSDNAEMYYWNAVQFGVEVQKQGRMLQRLYSLGFSLSITSMLFTWLQLYKRQYHFQSEGKFWQQPFVSMIGHLYQNQSPCGNPQPLKHLLSSRCYQEHNPCQFILSHNHSIELIFIKLIQILS